MRGSYCKCRMNLANPVAARSPPETSGERRARPPARPPPRSGAAAFATKHVGQVGLGLGRSQGTGGGAWVRARLPPLRHRLLRWATKNADLSAARWIRTIVGSAQAGGPDGRSA